MFRNNTGELCADAEAVAQKIKGASVTEIEALHERRGILRDALNSFEARLEDLPERERNAALSLLYKEIADIVFDFHLSIATNASRSQIVNATTRTEKLEALRAFQSDVRDLAMLYGIA